MTKANDGTSLFHNILNVFPFSICLFSFICLQSSVDIGLQPNDDLLGRRLSQILQSAGGEENGETGQECRGINERSLRRDHHFPGCDQQWHHQAHRERQVEIACWIKAYLDK